MRCGAISRCLGAPFFGSWQFVVLGFLWPLQCAGVKRAHTWSKVAADHSSAKNTTSSSARPSVSKPAVAKLAGAQCTRKQAFYLGGIASECSLKNIEAFGSEYCSLLECRMMTSKRTGTQAARIVTAEDEVDKLKAIIWPEHLYLREWHFNVGWGTSQRWKVNEASH